MANPVFNMPYQNAYSASIEFETQIADKQLGGEQRYPKRIFPVRTFSVKFDKNPDGRAELEAFFVSVKGNALPFNWTWQTDKGGDGKTYECFFDNESLKENLHHFGYTETELKFISIDRNSVTPVENFDFWYQTQYKFSMSFNNLVDKVITAANNRRALWASHKKSWELVFSNTPEARKQIEDFFISKRGRFKAFQWVWETDKGGDGQTYWVRFDIDKLDISTYLGWSQDFTVPIKEVVPQAPAPDEELEKDEIIPRRLLFLDIDGSPIRIVDNETLQALSFGGENYLGAPMSVGDLKKSDNTEVTNVNVSVSNVAQAISGLIGQNGDIVSGSAAYLYLVFLDTTTFELLEDYQYLLFAGKCNNLKIDSVTASVDVTTTLGGFEKKAPVMTYGVSCQYLKFKDVRCGYSGPQSSCDRTLTTCKRLGNVERFGGFPSMPSEQVIKV